MKRFLVVLLFVATALAPAIAGANVINFTGNLGANDLFSVVNGDPFTGLNYDMTGEVTGDPMPGLPGFLQLTPVDDASHSLNIEVPPGADIFQYTSVFPTGNFIYAISGYVAGLPFGTISASWDPALSPGSGTFFAGVAAGAPTFEDVPFFLSGTFSVLDPAFYVDDFNFGASLTSFVVTVTTPNFTAVPEPGTMALLGSGLVGLAGWGRRKFRR